VKAMLNWVLKFLIICPLLEATKILWGINKNENRLNRNTNLIPRGGALGDLHLTLSNRTSRVYRIVSNETVYSNYRTVILRTVEHSISKYSGEEIRSNVSYDLIAHKGTESAAIIVAWNTTSKTVTLVEEYHPGPNSRLVGPAAGLVDPIKHRLPEGSEEIEKDFDMALIAARWEMEEELRLKGGTWHRLTNAPAYMDKYVICRVYPFLCIDPERVEHDKQLPRDKEEEHDMEILCNITVPELIEMISTGEMNLVGSWTCLLAIQKLRDIGEI